MAIPDLTTEQRIKACAWFIENDKHFLMHVEGSPSGYETKYGANVYFGWIHIRSVYQDDSS